MDEQQNSLSGTNGKKSPRVSPRVIVVAAILALLSLVLATGCLPRSWAQWTSGSESGSSAVSEP